VLRTRILTAAVALPLLLALIIFAPAWGFSLFIALCAAWALYEVAAMTAAGSPALIALVAAVGVASAIVTLAWAPQWSVLPAAAALALMCRLIAWIKIGGVKKTLSRPLLGVIGALYVGALFPHFALLRDMHHGVRLLLLMLAAVIAGDSGAYFVGRAIGHIKLIPDVSPGKTVEGALAYIVCGVAAVCLLNIALGVGWSLGTAAGFGGLISVVAQAGDLAESAFKRLAGVKDSGWLFPGHGGLLDRADSLVFAAVFAYYYSRWLGLAAG
jgi:phosphatidate cytidylyltransferase